MANPLYDTLFGCHAQSEAPFLKLADGSTVEYGAFVRMAARFAHAITKAGLMPGDRLAAQIAKSPEALAGYAAVSYTHLTLPTIVRLPTTVEHAASRNPPHDPRPCHETIEGSDH